MEKYRINVAVNRIVHTALKDYCEKEDKIMYKLVNRILKDFLRQEDYLFETEPSWVEKAKELR